MNFVFSLLVALLATLAFLGSPVSAAPKDLPSGWTNEDMIRNLGITTDFVFLPDERLLVMLKAGRILLVKGKRVSNIALDLSNRLGNHYGDRGLMTMEVDPDFPAKPYIYVGYVWDGTPQIINSLFGKYNSTWPRGAWSVQGPKINRLSRFTMTGDVIDPDSEEVIFGKCTQLDHGWWGTDCWPMSGPTHSIDWVKFGPDGALWVTMGDGATFEGTDWYDWIGNDWLGPMDPNFPLGKVLRVDRNGNGLADNPFFDGNVNSIRSKVWAVGIRQPWRCAFPQRDYDVAASGDPVVVNSLFCGVVGWFSFENVVRIGPGSNLGWPCYEGSNERTPLFIIGGRAETDQSICSRKFYKGDWKGYPSIDGKTMDVPPYTPRNVPWTWSHMGQSTASIGGVFLPKTYGKNFSDVFIFADFVSSNVYGLAWDFENNRAVGWDDDLGYASISGQIKTIATNMDEPVTFKIGPDGNVWILGHCVECSSYGILRRLIPAGGNTTVPGANLPNTTNAAPGVVANATTPGSASCYPKDKPKIIVPELPKDWDSIMYVSKFPGTQYARNGNFGPVEIDSSVGGARARDGNVMSVNGVWFTRGLGTKATSEIHVPLLGYCHRFYTEVGIDDQSGIQDAPDHKAQNKLALGEFVVKTNGKTWWNHTAMRGDYMRAGDTPETIDIIHLENVTDLGLYGYKPWGNTYPMDESLNFLDWGEAKLFCGPDSPYMPVVDITFPEPKNKFQLNDDVVFTGVVQTYDEKDLPLSSYEWYINLIHCQGSLCHTHFYESFPGVKSGSFITEPHPLASNEQFIYYEIKLVGTDLCGRSSFAFRNVLIGNATDGAGKPDLGFDRNPVLSKTATATLSRPAAMTAHVSSGSLAATASASSSVKPTLKPLQVSARQRFGGSGRKVRDDEQDAWLMEMAKKEQWYLAGRHWRRVGL